MMMLMLAAATGYVCCRYADAPLLVCYDFACCAHERDMLRQMRARAARQQKTLRSILRDAIAINICFLCGAERRGAHIKMISMMLRDYLFATPPLFFTIFIFIERH